MLYETFAPPVLPFLVVTIITPFEARAPYIEAAAASFNTCIDSMSLGFNPPIPPTGIPSTIYNGALSPKDEKPRIFTDDSAPGRLSWVTVTPATLPCNCPVAFAEGIDLRSLTFTTDTEPVISFLAWEV